MKKLIYVLAALTLAAGSAQAQDTRAVKPILSFGLTGGGETLYKVRYTDGDTASIRSGGLVALVGGAEFRLGGGFALQTTVGYHVDDVNAKNGSLKFERYPLSVTGLYSLTNQFRLGVGVEHVANAKVRGSGVVGGASESFKSSTGLSLEGEYLFNPHWSVKLRAVQHKYESKRFLDEVDGNYYGVFGSFYF
jgi:hypothetical protein